MKRKIFEYSLDQQQKVAFAFFANLYNKFMGLKAPSEVENVYLEIIKDAGKHAQSAARAFKRFQLQLINSGEVDKINEDLISGGKGDKKQPSDFDIRQVLIGVAVEFEHTNNMSQSLEITLDHLTENPKYYTDLIEKGVVDEEDAIQLYQQLYKKETKKINENSLRLLILKLIKEEIGKDLESNVNYVGPVSKSYLTLPSEYVRLEFFADSKDDQVAFGKVIEKVNKLLDDKYNDTVNPVRFDGDYTAISRVQPEPKTTKRIIIKVPQCYSDKKIKITNKTTNKKELLTLKDYIYREAKKLNIRKGMWK